MAYLDARPAPPDSSLTKFLAILKIVHLANALSVFVSTLARFLAILKMVHLATAVYLFVCTPFPAPTSDLSSVNPIECQQSIQSTDDKMCCEPLAPPPLIASATISTS